MLVEELQSHDRCPFTPPCWAPSNHRDISYRDIACSGASQWRYRLNQNIVFGILGYWISVKFCIPTQHCFINGFYPSNQTLKLIILFHLLNCLLEPIEMLLLSNRRAPLTFYLDKRKWKWKENRLSRVFRTRECRRGTTGIQAVESDFNFLPFFQYLDYFYWTRKWCFMFKHLGPFVTTRFSSCVYFKRH